MGDTGTREEPSRASRFFAASQHAAKTGASAASGAARAGAAAVNGTGRFVHRMTTASGAGRTGLSSLLELSIASAIGDAFVVIALAGTLFFNSSAEQARGRAAFALIVTIAPYAILAPLIGPMLDRVRKGNKYILTRHAAGARPAVLGHGRGGAAQRHRDAGAGRAGRARAAEGLRGHQGRGDAAAAAARDHAGVGQLPVQPGLAAVHVGRGGGRARDRPHPRRSFGRRGLDTAGGDDHLPRGHGARLPAAGPGRRPDRG